MCNEIHLPFNLRRSVNQCRHIKFTFVYSFSQIGHLSVIISPSCGFYKPRNCKMIVKRSKHLMNLSVIVQHSSINQYCHINLHFFNSSSQIVHLSGVITPTWDFYKPRNCNMNVNRITGLINMLVIVQSFVDQSISAYKTELFLWSFHNMEKSS